MRDPLPIARRAVQRAAQGLRRSAARASLPQEGGIWVALRLDESLGESPFPQRAGELPAGLLDALRILDACPLEPGVVGVFIHLEGLSVGWSAAQSLRRAISGVRERGLPVVVYADQLDAESLLVASGATRIFMPESGRVFLVGVRAEGFYLRELLEAWDVEADVVRIGRHKSAGEMFTRKGMSEEQRAQLEELADDLYEALVGAIAEGRGLDAGEVRDLIDRGPYTAAAALEAGLVDACLYPDELEASLEALTPVPSSLRPGPRRISRIDARQLQALQAVGPDLRDPFALAYVVAQGSIHRASSGRGIASGALTHLLEELRRDPAIRGIALRIDSPGGDALASDLLWRAVDRVREEKPVVATLGGVAASGGYYLASAADVVMAERGSVTGSIGVIGGKLNLDGLYRRLGIGRDAVERGRRAGMLSETRAFTADERRAVRGEMEVLYATFVDRVARGRGITADAVHRVAQGRVWSGARALPIGLVDAIGGPLEALRELHTRAGVRPGESVVVAVHPRFSRWAGVRAALRWLR
jgi:protease-4